MARQTGETLKDHLVVVGSFLPFSFSTDYVKQTCLVLSLNNFVVVFLWGDALTFKEMLVQHVFLKTLSSLIRKEQGITLFTPIHYIPFRRFEFVRQVNLLLNVLILRIYLFTKGLLKPKRVLWIFNYELYNMPIMMGRPFISLYDCVDWVSSLDADINAAVKHKESLLIQRVDHFFVNSEALKSRFPSDSPIVVPQGFDFRTFKSAKAVTSTKLRGIKHPIIGYVGGINYRLDYPLLTALAAGHPEWSFVFVGEKQVQKSEDRYVHTKQRLLELLSLENVFHIGKQTKATLPALISQFDVCLIPYNINIVFNQYCYPMKLFEYLYMGKPVVSTPIKPLLPLKPYVSVARNGEEFSRAIHRALQKKPSPNFVKKQKQLAIDNSWDAKVQSITHYITDHEMLSSSQDQS